ncbi:MAG: glucokinase, partial [Alphaproteobacteria bacterium]|nr:glucokinase [Alphaproteobacteria bacterium]
MTTLLADIGGTHARVALDTADGPVHPEKFRAADFAALQDVLAAYCAQYKLPSGGRVAIGTAAHPDENGVWWFQNLNEWGIDPTALRAAGWDVPVLVNDFVASSCGAVTIPATQLTTLRVGAADNGIRHVVLGPGTGLGLGFVEKIADRWHVQETLGGHMFGASATDEQFMVSKVVRRLRGGDMMFIHEDVCSGVGLPVLYRAVCLCNGQPVAYDSAADLLMNKDDKMMAAALRLFHEFLGLYTHNALVTGHAFGGVYLDGGLTQHLVARGVFDFETFLKFMTMEPAVVVRQKIDATPIHI